MIRKTLLLLVALTAIGGVHASDPALTFPPTKIELPPLSALEAAHASRNPLSFPNPPRPMLPSRPTFPRAGQRLFSKMPILVPRSDIDPKLILSPNPAIDYKLRIVVPEVESIPSK